jgi:hypothetical protein
LTGRDNFTLHIFIYVSCNSAAFRCVRLNGPEKETWVRKLIKYRTFVTSDIVKISYGGLFFGVFYSSVSI